MSVSRLLALVLAGAAWGFSPASAAQTPSDSASGPSGSDIQTWLRRIHDAAGRQNFQGTLVVSSGGNVASARMAHFCEGANQFERIESLDGRVRNVFRYNDIVHTVWPSSRVAVVEQRGLLNSFPAVLQEGAQTLGEWYHLQAEGNERVAGRDARVLLVKAKDAYRYGYKLWADQASGLLLRADVLSERGEVLETSAFSDISIGVRAQPETVLQPMRKVEGFRVLRPVIQVTQLETEGWNLRQPAPGFRQVTCLSREMNGSADPNLSTGSEPVLQAIYADGLTYISVFIEPYKPARHTKPLVAAVGATRTLSQRQGDWWVTVVGDAPAATLRLFANNLERKK